VAAVAAPKRKLPRPAAPAIGPNGAKLIDPSGVAVDVTVAVVVGVAVPVATAVAVAVRVVLGIEVNVEVGAAVGVSRGGVSSPPQDVSRVASPRIARNRSASMIFAPYHGRRREDHCLVRLRQPILALPRYYLA
jgi:hypothetical protein